MRTRSPPLTSPSSWTGGGARSSRAPTRSSASPSGCSRRSPPLLRAGIRMSTWLTSDLNVNLPRLGLPRQAFGGAMVTSVGMWGITNAYSPLAAYYRVPVLVLVGAVESRPVARAGCVVVRPMLTVTATFDHRYVDGYQAAQFAAAIREYCVDPACYEPPLEQVDLLPSRPLRSA